jgi:hypothetical protein
VYWISTRSDRVDIFFTIALNSELLRIPQVWTFILRMSKCDCSISTLVHGVRLLLCFPP